MVVNFYRYKIIFYNYSTKFIRNYIGTLFCGTPLGLVDFLLATRGRSIWPHKAECPLLCDPHLQVSSTVTIRELVHKTNLDEALYFACSSMTSDIYVCGS